MKHIKVSHDSISSIERNEKIVQLYNSLLSEYGSQGWWPIKSMIGKKGFDERGYHKGNFSFPKTKNQRFEIVVGAILTQNTNWKNAEKALDNLISNGLLSPELIIDIDQRTLSEKIRSAGYFNQKAKKLKHISEWFIRNDDKLMKFSHLMKSLQRHSGKTEKSLEKRNEEDYLKKIQEIRLELLSVHGVGFETADSILLYAYNLPIFVVDTYTKRLFRKNNLVSDRNNKLKHEEEYHLIQKMVESAFSNLPLEKRVEVYNEFHALTVEWGKNEKRNKISSL